MDNAYSKFTDARIKANDAMIALLIGSRLSSITIHGLDLSEGELLKAYFNEINLQGHERFNLTSSEALRVLSDAENHLAYMAIPYTLSIYERFVRDVIKILKASECDSIKLMRDDEIRDLKLDKMHAIIFTELKIRFDPIDDGLFNVIRQIRNRIMHSGGTSGSHVISEYKNMKKEYKAEWERLAGRPLTSALKDGRFVFNDGELFATLAICQRLVNQINQSTP